MGSYIRDTGQLQQALHGSVLTVLSVENREHHIHRLTHHTVSFKAQKALSPNGRNSSRTIAGMLRPQAAGQLGIVVPAIKNPCAFFGNSHRKNIIFFPGHMVQHRLCGAQGNLMLRAHTAKQNQHIDFTHTLPPNSQCFSLHPLTRPLRPGKCHRHPRSESHPPSGQQSPDRR